MIDEPRGQFHKVRSIVRLVIDPTADGMLGLRMLACYRIRLSSVVLNRIK